MSDSWLIHVVENGVGAASKQLQKEETTRSYFFFVPTFYFNLSIKHSIHRSRFKENRYKASFLACEQALWSGKERRKQRAGSSEETGFSRYFPTAEPVYRLLLSRWEEKGNCDSPETTV